MRFWIENAHKKCLSTEKNVSCAKTPFFCVPFYLTLSLLNTHRHTRNNTDVLYCICYVARHHFSADSLISKLNLLWLVRPNSLACSFPLCTIVWEKWSISTVSFSFRAAKIGPFKKNHGLNVWASWHEVCNYRSCHEKLKWRLTEARIEGWHEVAQALMRT